MRYINPGLTWRPLSCANALDVAARIEKVLALWEHTPYMSGQSCQGIQADCIGFAFGAVADLYRTPVLERPTLPPDASMHDGKGARRVVRQLRKLYMPNELIRDGSIEPGDLPVFGTRGPGHVYFVGARPNTLWHCNIGIGVRRTGLAMPEDMNFFGVYRILNKEQWA